MKAQLAHQAHQLLTIVDTPSGAIEIQWHIEVSHDCHQLPAQERGFTPGSERLAHSGGLDLLEVLVDALQRAVLGE